MQRCCRLNVEVGLKLVYATSHFNAISCFGAMSKVQLKKLSAYKVKSYYIEYV
jgi:hypothetical protein